MQSLVCVMLGCNSELLCLGFLCLGFDHLLVVLDFPVCLSFLHWCFLSRFSAWCFDKLPVIWIIIKKSPSIKGCMWILNLCVSKQFSSKKKSSYLNLMSRLLRSESNKHSLQGNITYFFICSITYSCLKLLHFS